MRNLIFILGLLQASFTYAASSGYVIINEAKIVSVSCGPETLGRTNSCLYRLRLNIGASNNYKLSIDNTWGFSTDSFISSIVSPTQLQPTGSTDCAGDPTPEDIEVFVQVDADYENSRTRCLAMRLKAFDSRGLVSMATVRDLEGCRW